MADDDDTNAVTAVAKAPTFTAKPSHEAKIRELLCNINSTEIKISSYASKEFAKLLKTDTGGELLHQYVQASSTCSEFIEAWKIHQGNKLGMSYLLNLISDILSHSSGKYEANDSGRVVISRVLDKFASFIVKEKLDDVYKEFNSKEPKQQKAALLLMAAIVRRGSGIANDVANSFNFKLPSFVKLASHKFKVKPDGKMNRDSTRKAFVWFAMSFLEVGKPWLLRGILQQRVMYSGVLRGLGNDDDETIDYVLSTLRDRVLTPESNVRASLRSVLFGSATLELLATISGSENGGEVAELAHQVLVMACTDPSNGLMPDLNMRPNPLKGNLKRLLDLMKKLKATEVDHHKDLLLSIVTGRPTFCAAYLDEFPYNLEDYTSPSWFAAVCLAANLVSAVGTEISFSSLSSLPSFSSVEVQNFIKCICPRPFSRSVINKGLLHSDTFVTHGTLRLLLESLKLLDFLVNALNQLCCSGTIELRSWESLKQEIQNEVQTFLPDPQVLLKLVSSLSTHSRAHPALLKRKRKQTSGNSPKRSRNEAPKSNVMDEDTDIIISGISPDSEIALPGDSDVVPGTFDEENSEEVNLENIIANIWGSHESSSFTMTPEDSEIYLNAKLLDALTLYLRTMPNVLDGSFDFFVDLLSSPLTLPTNLLLSLLSLLLEYIGSSNRMGVSIRIPPLMYKNLHSFVNLLLLSPIKSIRDQAYCLARAAMISTGAFDRNLLEVSAWLLFLPGYSADESSVEMSGIEVFRNLSPVVISFLCDAISTVGNNLFKYWDLVRSHIKRKDLPPNFSPLIICVLQKCLRLLNSDTETFTLPKKTAISLYTCNTLCYILQNQVDPGLLSSLIGTILLEGLKNHSLDSGESSCEWRPLRKLWLFIQGISDERPFPLITFETKSMHVDTSFANLLGEVQRGLKSGHIDGLAGVTTAFASAVICTTSDDLVANFPLVIFILHNLLGAPFSVLSSKIFLEQRFLFDVSKLWPDLFTRGLQMVLSSNLSADSGNGAERMLGHGQSSNVAVCNLDYDSNESAPAAFSYFLKVTSFHVLFPLIMRIDGQLLVEPTKIQQLLLAKLSGKPTDYLRSSLRIVLFWIHQIQLSYRNKQLTGMYQLSEICLNLLENMLANILVLKDDSGGSTKIEVPFSTQIREVAETIFGHPVIELYLARPLGRNEKPADGILATDADIFSLSSHRVHEMDHHILHILKTTSGYLLSLCKGENSISKVDDDTKKQLGKVLKVLVQRLFVEFRNRFEICTGSKNFMPLVATVHAICDLIHFISPFELLELVRWMFNRIDKTDVTLDTPCKLSALSFIFYIAGGAFEVLSNYLKEPITRRVAYNLLWTMGENNCDAHLFEQIYYKLCNYATCLDLDSAIECLLKAVNVFSRQKYIEDQQFLPLSVVALRVIESNPIQILCHSIKTISRNKAKLLFALTKLSPLHSSVFGYVFSAILDKDMLLEGNLMEKSFLSDDELMLLLPTALSYLNSVLVKFGKQSIKNLRSITSGYSRILLKGFLDWQSYVSHSIFEVECDELPSSTDKILNFVKDTLLGKAVQMLQYHIVLSAKSIKLKKRLKLFDSVCSQSALNSGLLDCDDNEFDAFSLSQSLNFINRLVARISFCRILLFSEDGQKNLPEEGHEGVQDSTLGKASDKEVSARMRFVNMLVSSWLLIVKKFPSRPINYGNGNMSDNLRLFKSLEVFILKSIAELTRKMSKNLAQLPSIPFIEQLSRSSLLYRFEDPTTLRMLRSVLSSLSQANISFVLVLQLLVSHSQFAPVITSILEPSGCELGACYRPVSSVLKSPVISPVEQTEIDEKEILESHGVYEKQLEVIKLLRLLFTVKANQFESEKPVINFKELLMLLLSSYGATLNEIDLEIYHLMHDIESHEGLDSGNIADMDYLWGTAALKSRKEQTDELNVSTDGMAHTPAIEDCRRSQFRENIPVDLKLCLATVIHFPFDRTLSGGNLSWNKIHPDSVDDNLEVQSSRAEKIQRYDPIFILRFSIHSLSAGYIEPIEFAGFGLLAIAFVSISSSDNGIRKLGYEALSRFKHALEICQKRKDVVRLKLLLSYMQNGIAEPWQKIPSVIAIFAAEASFVLLDPSNDHYSTISNLLTSSSKVNLKCIPLFHNLLGSSSSNFTAERLWILRVAYAGLNLEEDAYIYTKNSIFETILSFYVSPLIDNESRELILQILKKAVKLYKAARYLVEQCGFISWLSSILSFCSGKLCIGQKSPHNTVLEITSDIISSRNTVEWLQKNSLEQLMEFSTHLYTLLVGERRFMKENAALFNSVLQIIASTIKISQKRRIFQPHFTLSVDGLFDIHEAVCSNKASGISAVLGLKLILMSTPPATIFQKNKEKLLKFLSWATATAISSDATQTLQYENSYHTLAISSEELHEESMISKLLRWLTASVIIGKLCWNSSKMSVDDQDRPKLDTLQSVLYSYKKARQENGNDGFVCEEVITSTIFYLQQLLGKDCRVLPSVVSALCLVRLTDDSTPTGSESSSMFTSGVPVASLLSKIRSPAETNPLWRWSYYQPWKDHLVEQSDLEKMDELHACRHLLVLISNILGNKSPEFQVHSYQNLENSGVFKWERNVFQSE